MADEEGYTGPATLQIGDKELTVTVELRGYFQPIDGYYHWYGRLTENKQLDDLLAGKKAQAHLTTPQGNAPAELSDPDPWNRYRITGTSKPPFDLTTTP